jgi:hypothetical protein
VSEGPKHRACVQRHEQKEDSLKGETEGAVLQMALHVIMSNGITCMPLHGIFCFFFHSLFIGSVIVLFMWV